MNLLAQNHRLTFQSQVKQLFSSSPTQPEKIAVLPTTEYEGIFRNGGVGTYYKNLAKRLHSQGWCVILLSCDFESDYQGKSHLPELDYIFTTNQIKNILNLSSCHLQMLQSVENQWVDYIGYSCLFFLGALAEGTASQGAFQFPETKIYVEFHEMLGFAYHTLQGKQTNILGDNIMIGVTMHSGHEWIYEANEKHHVEHPEWLWQIAHYEQYCCENALLTFFPSHYLTTRVKSYGWDINKGKNHPNYIPII